MDNSSVADKQAMADVDKFINQMLDDKKISGETPVSRRYLVADLRRQLMEQIDREMISALSDDQLELLSSLLDRDDLTDEQLQNFFQRCGVDSQAVVFNTMMRFRALYLGDLKPEQAGDAAAAGAK